MSDLRERLLAAANAEVESPAPHFTGDMKFYVFTAEHRALLLEAAHALVERAGEPVAEPMYGEIAAPQDALYEQAAAMDNQDVPLEEWPDKLIGALARSGYAVVPCSLPPVVLGEAYISGAFDTGNPKHGWDYLLSKVRAYPRFNTAPGASHER